MLSILIIIHEPICTLLPMQCCTRLQLIHAHTKRAGHDSVLTQTSTCVHINAYNLEFQVKLTRAPIENLRKHWERIQSPYTVRPPASWCIQTHDLLADKFNRGKMDTNSNKLFSSILKRMENAVLACSHISKTDMLWCLCVRSCSLPHSATPCAVSMAGWSWRNCTCFKHALKLYSLSLSVSLPLNVYTQLC